ncbi:cation transporter [Candidatus Hecatella orcuttiae]|jgi:copper chaperone CopZ|uniref:cation transporter n=1 Tax=Candidatus Hecatella orcuttiae TaxID=1935119 RepID=UPI002867C223|nr:cation transporter [Candidatus Hecatella orcuttiae]
MVSAILIHLKRKSKACKINLFTKEGLRREKYFIATAIIVMLTVYGLSVYVITPTFAPIVYGMFSPAASPTSTSGEVNPRGLHQLSLKIGGMYCPSCGYVIWYTLNQKDGVIEVKISLSKEEGTVIYDPAEISGEEIVHVIESLGYNAKILADKPIED